MGVVSVDSPATTEAAAEALFCEIWEGSDAWELATDSQKATTRQWVAAVLAALNLTEERGTGVRTSNWPPIRTGTVPPPQNVPMRRLVGPWVRDVEAADPNNPGGTQ